MVDDFPCMDSTESKKYTDDKDDAAFAVLVVSLPQFETGEKNGVRTSKMNCKVPRVVLAPQNQANAAKLIRQHMISFANDE